jgi:crossover junction endodeoxyribonuclease RuvC
VIAGIDPGLAGALFFLDPSNSANGEAIDLPVHMLIRGAKKKRELDIAGLIGILATRSITHAFVESVGAMPGQGVSSVFSFGKTFGAVLGVIAARNIPITLIAPARWKKVMGVGKSKDGCRARASQLLPRCADQWKLRRDDGRAEAALLCLYGLQQLGGTAAVPADVFVLSVPAALEAPTEARR